MAENTSPSEKPVVVIPETDHETAAVLPSPAPGPAQSTVASPAGQGAGKPVSDESPLRKKFRRAIEPTLEKFGFKKGRGRPKKCRACDGTACEKCNWTGFEPSKSDVPPVGEVVDVPASVEPVADEIPGAVSPAPVVPPVAGPTGEQVSPVIDPGLRAEIDNLFRRLLVNGAKGSVDGSKKVLKILSKAAGNSDAFTERTLAEVQPPPESLEDFSDSVKLVVKNRQPRAMEKNGDLVCMGLAGAKLFAPFGIACFELVREIYRRREVEAREKKRMEAEAVAAEKAKKSEDN